MTKKIGYVSPVFGGWEFSDASDVECGFRATARTKSGALQKGLEAGFTHYRDLGRDFAPEYQWGSKAPVRKIRRAKAA